MPDLKDHVLLHTSNANSDEWRLWLSAAGLPADFSKQPGVTFDLIFMTVQAAIDGSASPWAAPPMCRRTSRRDASWFPSGRVPVDTDSCLVLARRRTDTASSAFRHGCCLRAEQPEAHNSARQTQSTSSNCIVAAEAARVTRPLQQAENRRADGFRPSRFDFHANNDKRVHGRSLQKIRCAGDRRRQCGAVRRDRARRAGASVLVLEGRRSSIAAATRATPATSAARTMPRPRL